MKDWKSSENCITTEDLVNIYILYFHSVLEFNCCVWRYDLTEEQRIEIEIVQKIACKIIQKQKYVSYEKALDNLGLDTLDDRRYKPKVRFRMQSY